MGLPCCHSARIPSWPKGIVAKPHQWASQRGTLPLVGPPRAGRDPLLSGQQLMYVPHALPAQYIDAISNKQGELENYVSDGYKTALTEERRRFCFLVEKQCAVAKNSAAYHSKVRPAGRRDWLPGGRRGCVHVELCGKEHRVFQIPPGTAFW